MARGGRGSILQQLSALCSVSLLSNAATESCTSCKLRDRERETVTEFQCGKVHNEWP